jgi:long-chain acyl-CoA synthetase
VDLTSFFSGSAFATDERIIEFSGTGITYGQMLNHVENLAVQVRAAARPGSRVGLSLPSAPVFVCALLAIVRAGCEPVLLNPLMSQQRAALLAERAAVEAVVSDGAWPGSVVMSAAALAEPVDGRAPVVESPSARVREVSLFTSGSSGPPKLISLTGETLTGALDRHRRFGLESTDEKFTLIVKPLFHMSGIWNLLVALALGRRLVLQEKFEPLGFASLVQEFALTRASVTTSMLVMLGDRADSVREALRTLRVIRAGAMPLTTEVRSQWESEFGSLILDAYGQTETCGEIAGWTLPMVDEIGHSSPDRQASGRIHPDVEIRLARHDGHLMAPGEGTGEICVRAPGFTQKIDGQPILERSGDGFHHTGDLGHVDARGLLFVVGRQGRVINRGGFNVSPEAIEDCLTRQGTVSEAVVVPLADRRLGQVPVALITARREIEIDQQALISWASQELGPNMAPRRIVVVPELPRLPSGKIDLEAARLLAEQDATSRIATGSDTERRYS